jgi:late competence protein required for DNA uptake (superfamily II DNA/RNA helicase)
MFKFANKQAVINDIYPVVSAYVTEDQLMELYEHATSEPHSALVIDGTHSKIVFKKNFDRVLELNS